MYGRQSTAEKLIQLWPETYNIHSTVYFPAANFEKL